jgi:propanediol dehydratase small subunit
MTVARSGRPVDEITLDAVRAGEITPADIRIHPTTLAHQARVAEEHANPQLAANFRRAAELTDLSDDRVMAIYEALRPRRSTKAELLSVADELDGADAPLNAALVREAADAYEARGLLR